MEYLRCVSCASVLSVRSLVTDGELEEGFLDCTNCKASFPVISSVPFMLPDLASYLSIRAKLGGQLMLMARSDRMRSFVKETLKKAGRTSMDTTDLEKRWVGIYKKSITSRFYSVIKDSMKKIPPCNLVLEHGCSIGNVAKESAKRHTRVFGIDKSFYGILEAKRQQRKNSDFVVADSINHPFGSQKFDLVMALNLLDIIEPEDLLNVISCQAGKFLVLSDPYDFERGKSSVKSKTSPQELRSKLQSLGFTLIQNTRRPNHISWSLEINSRLTLNYRVDLLVGQKKS